MKRTLLRKSDRTRQLIIEKSAPVFNKKGFAGTSMADIAEAAGLTKGCVYGNFKNKDDVALSVFQYNVDNLVYYLGREMDKEETYQGKILAIPSAYRKIFNRMVEYGGCPLLNTAAEADDTHKELCNLTIKAIEAFKDIIIGLIEAGIEAGEFKKEVDVENLAELSISLIEGGMMLSKVTCQKSYLMRSLDQMEALILGAGAE